MYKNLKYSILIIIILMIPTLVATSKAGLEKGLISASDRFTWEYNSDWEYSWDNRKSYKETSLPAKVGGGKTNSVLWISNNMPKQHLEGAAVFLRSSQQLMKVYIDGKLVYSYGYNGKRDMSFLPGSSWHFVKLPEGYEGRKLEISLVSPYKQYSGNINSIYFGTESSLIIKVISQYGIILIIASIIFVLGIILLIIYIILKSEEGRFKSLLYLGLFSILSSIWIASESKVIQLLINDPVLLFYSACISLFLFPIPFLLFILNTYKPSKGVLLKGFIYLFTGFFIIASILQIFNNTIYINSMPFYNIMLLGCIAAAIYISVIEIKKRNEEIRLFFIGCIILCIFSIKDIFGFYFSKIPGLNAQGTLQYAILTMILFLSASLGHYILNILNRYEKNKIYESLAYSDLLTGLNNRNSYEQAVSEINYQNIGQTDLSVIIFDINNLKEVNDQFGHQAGDRLIFNASEIVKQCFGRLGQIYRIGGDEFAAIFKEIDENTIKAQLLLLKQEINKYNYEEQRAKISIAYGMARFLQGSDRDFSSVLTRADKEMYKCKRQQKSQVN